MITKHTALEIGLTHLACNDNVGESLLRKVDYGFPVGIFNKNTPVNSLYPVLESCETAKTSEDQFSFFHSPARSVLGRIALLHNRVTDVSLQEMMLRQMDLLVDTK